MLMLKGTYAHWGLMLGSCGPGMGGVTIRTCMRRGGAHRCRRTVLSDELHLVTLLSSS